MISSNMYNYINVLNKAAGASWKRHELISGNLANVSTPGYKRKDAQFESYLVSALAGGNNLDKAVANIDLNTLTPSTYTDNSNLSYRLDGNNVDVDTEHSYLAQNQLRYYMLLDSMIQEFNRIKTALTVN